MALPPLQRSSVDPLLIPILQKIKVHRRLRAAEHCHTDERCARVQNRAAARCCVTGAVAAGTVLQSKRIALLAAAAAAAASAATAAAAA